MNLTNLIEHYVAADEQEEKDKDIFLKCLHTFADCITRNNEIAHLTSSAFLLNKERDKALMVHHNIFNAWSWPGGHADGNEDLLEVAMNEVREETGLKNIRTVLNEIISLNVIPVKGHIKKGKYVSPHLHLSAAFLLEADEIELLTVKEDENSKVQWIPLKDLEVYITEPHMMEIYERIISRLRNRKIL